MKYHNEKPPQELGDSVFELLSLFNTLPNPIEFNNLNRKIINQAKQINQK